MATLKVDKEEVRAIPVDELGAKAQEMIQSIYVSNTSIFTGAKPMTQLIIEALVTDYNGKRNTFKQGGTAAKIPYDTAHEVLIVALLLFAPYIDGIANGNEDILKLGVLPYSDGTNDSASRIRKGDVPDKLTYVAGVGSAKTSCASFGRGTKFIAILVKGGLLPAGVFMNLDGQLMFPDGVTMPPHIININGKRNKTITGLESKTDYYLYYVVIANGYVSGLSQPLLIGCKN